MATAAIPNSYESIRLLHKQETSFSNHNPLPLSRTWQGPRLAISALLLAVVGLLAGSRTATGQESVLFSFPAPGCVAQPDDAPIFDAKGNLYGTCLGPSPNGGFVYELSPGAGGAWTEQILFPFANNGANDTGSQPNGLVFDAKQVNLYGTTSQGGANNTGVVFELSPGTGGWTETVIYSFGPSGGADGYTPLSGVVLDGSGNLYGTTSAGGAEGADGTVYELSPGAGGVWTEKLLHSFSYFDGGGNDFQARPIFDSKGNLYGVSPIGGAASYGGVFELSPAGGGAWTETVLYSFGLTNSTDGQSAVGALVFDGAGNLYGASESGGENSEGTVYELSPPKSGTAWTETLLHQFSDNGVDGYTPVAGVAIDSKGNLYGTASAGGIYNGTYGKFGYGTIYELSPGSSGWTYQTLYNFNFATNFTDARDPWSNLAFDAAGNLYGAANGGSNNGGSVFEYAFAVPTAATPTFSPAAGSYTGAQSVEILDTTSNATLYYTTDGTTPSTSSSKYTEAIPVSSSQTIHAIAVAAGFANSLVASAQYTITPPTYTLSLTPGTLTFASTTVGSTSAAQIVTIKNTGTGSVSLSSETLTGTSPGSYLISANTCGASLASGASCSVSVEFKPASTGTLTASLSVVDIATESPQTVSLTGTGAEAPTYTVSLSPSTLTFASTTVGSTSAAQIVTIKNTGTGSVSLSSETLTGTSPGSYLISTNTCGASLTSGASCAVSVEFKPTVAGTLNSSLSVADNASASPQAVTLTGTGTAVTTSTLAITPASLNLTFPSTAVGSQSAVQQLVIKNTGTAAVSFTGFIYSGANASSFVQTGITCGSTLAAGSACAIAIALKPQSSGALTATLSIADSATGSPQKISLSGTGVASGTLGTLTITPASLSLAFASTTVGSQSAVQQVVVKNTGSIAVNFTGFTYTGTNAGSFVQTDITCGSSLAAGSACAIAIVFKPQSTGALTATLNITDSASGSPQKLTLSGTGVASGTVGTLAITPASLSLAFASTTVGSQSVVQQVVVKNTGSVTVTFTGFTYMGANASSFVQTDITCGSSLAAGSACAIAIAFKPQSTGTLTATLNITDSASGSPQQLTLTGTGK